MLRIMKITWINCSEQMPPSTGEIIIKSSSEQRISEFTRLCVDNCVFFNSYVNWQWTEFTKEKWEFLNAKS